MYMEYTNTENGLRSTVHHREDGKFTVALQDIDCGETLQTFKIFPDFEPARTYAMKIID